MPTHVLIKAKDVGLYRDSVVLCENPYCMPKENLGHYITTLPEQYMKRIARGHLLAISAISFLDEQSLIEVWKEALELNAIY